MHRLTDGSFRHCSFKERPSVTTTPGRHFGILKRRPSCSRKKQGLSLACERMFETASAGDPGLWSREVNKSFRICPKWLLACLRPWQGANHTTPDHGNSNRTAVKERAMTSDAANFDCFQLGGGFACLQAHMDFGRQRHGVLQGPVPSRNESSCRGSGQPGTISIVAIALRQLPLFLGCTSHDNVSEIEEPQVILEALLEVLHPATGRALHGLA